MTMTTKRQADLRRILLERKSELEQGIRERIRAGRSDRLVEVRDVVEHSDSDNEGDLGLALLHMHAETLERIGHALVRLDAGEYGSCVDCAGPIAQARLRALPFAVRCQHCEERREQDSGDAQHLARRQRHLSLFADAIGT